MIFEKRIKPKFDLTLRLRLFKMKQIMKTIKYLFCILTALLLTLPTIAKQKVKAPNSSKQETVYIVGVSASFTDSLMYFTDVQELEGVTLDKKKFLPNRMQYSYQLKDFLEREEGLTNRTCFVIFDTNRKKLDKKIFKMKRRYQKESKMFVQQVNPNTFHFNAIKEENTEE